MTVRWDDKAARAATQGPEVEEALLDAGWQVAEIAAVLAPKESGGGVSSSRRIPGEGAASIRAEVVRVNGVPEVRVSWDIAHFYMAFFEFGTEEITARPFLRPAAGRFR